VNKNKDFVVNEATLSETKNTAIILSPDWIAGSQLSYNVFGGFHASLLSKYVGKQYLDNTQTEDLTLENYFINDLRLNYSLTPKGMKGIDFSLLLNNVFDVKYSSNGATYGDGVAYYYPQAGRNFLAMMTFRF